MPATEFICPDGNRIKIADCLGNGCRLSGDLPGGRCLSVRTLRAIADQRPWQGKPSTTQLLKGTREAYLEIITDYAIDPQNALFRIHGSKAHAYLDQFVGRDELSEERLHTEYNSGMFDLYDEATHTLYDNKFSGSYKIMRALGLHQIDVPTGEVYKSGKNKGQPKTRKEWVAGGRKDRLDWAIQMNDYRMKLEALGFPVEHMIIEAIARDGGCWIAQRRGIQQNGVLIEINRISDHWIRRYMRKKAELLLRALETRQVPPKCKPRERWSGRKCEKYCNVREACEDVEFIKNHVVYRRVV